VPVVQLEVVRVDAWLMLPSLSPCTCRFVGDFVDEVPDDLFNRLPARSQENLQSPGKPRSRVQYYLMSMHCMSLPTALGKFPVGLGAGRALFLMLHSLVITSWI